MNDIERIEFLKKALEVFKKYQSTNSVEVLAYSPNDFIQVRVKVPGKPIIVFARSEPGTFTVTVDTFEETFCYRPQDLCDEIKTYLDEIYQVVTPKCFKMPRKLEFVIVETSLKEALSIMDSYLAD